MRVRSPNEIEPISAWQSNTHSDNEEKNAARHAIDLDLDTRSATKQSKIGKPKPWLKVKLDKDYCIHQVVWYLRKNGKSFLTWTCTSCHCSTCKGNDCSKYSLTISNGGTSTDCVYGAGDTVKLQRKNSRSSLQVLELAVIQKQGEKTYCEVQVHYYTELLTVKPTNIANVQTFGKHSI